MSYGHGNRKEQIKRRKQNNKDVPKQPKPYEMIDGNMTYFPYIYCARYYGVLTKNMTERHRCEHKSCPHAHEFEKIKDELVEIYDNRYKHAI